MPLVDSKEWRVRVSNNVPAIDAEIADLDKKNVGLICKVQTQGNPNGLESHTMRYFTGDTTPDNTDYPDTVAPIGSEFCKLTVNASGVVTAAEMYQKSLAGIWELFAGAGASVKVDDVTITTAQLLALFATPIEIVAAPPAGKAIILIDVQLFLDFNTAAYAGIAAGEDLAVKYTNAAGAIAATIETTGFLDATADDNRIVHPQEAAYAPVAAAALVLHLLVAEIITGDSPLKVRTRYKIVDLQT